MAYKAYLNNQIFFSTDAASDSLLLSAAKLSMQIGTSGSFTFTIPSCNAAYGNFHRLIDFVDVYRDNDLIFSGRVYSIKETFDTQHQIVCEGLLAMLNDSLFRPVTYDGYLHGLVAQILNSHNSQVEAAKQIEVGQILVTNSACYRAYQNLETSISRLQDLEKSFGGWMRVRRTNGVSYLDWYPDNIDGTSQRIDFGQNLINITNEYNADGIITVLIPLGAADDENVRVDIKSVNGGLDYIEASSEYIQQYGYVVSSQVWDDVHEPGILKTKGQQWLTACLTPRYTINVTAVDLADAGYDVDAFTVGQKIRVWSEPHDIDGVWFNCVQQNLDLLNPANNKLTLGTQRVDYIKASRDTSAEVRTSLERIASVYAPKSFMAEAIDTATRLIAGQLGGHIRWNDTDGDGEPDEFLIMDTPDIETAVKIWRFNLAGLGYSSSGYDGPYGLAMTMDGQIVADFITTGTLNADLIKAGILRGQAGGSYWNLVTGDLHIEGQTEVDKSKVFVAQPTIPYYVGDMWVTGYKQDTGVCNYAVADYAVVDNVGTDQGYGVIKVCIFTRTTGGFEESDWQIVTDYIDASALAGLADRVTSAELEIQQNTADILERATSAELDEESYRVTQAFEEIDGLEGRIDMMASQVTTGLNKSKTFREEPTTPYNIGDLWVTGTESYTAIVDEAIADDSQCDWGRDIFVCTTAKETGSFDLADWMKATKYIDDSQLYGVRQEIRNAQISIDAANSRIDLKADYTYVAALYQRIRTAEINIDGENARIDLIASASDQTEIGRRVHSAQIEIDGLNSTLSGTVSDLSDVEGRVTNTEAGINALAQNKLDGSLFTQANIIAKINQGTSSSTTTIAESKVNVTAENVIQKINDYGGNKKINMAKVDIVANTLVDTINNNATHNISKITLTAANVIGTINGSGGSTTTINEAKIELTAENVAGIINNSSVTISANNINLAGAVKISDFATATKNALLSGTSSWQEYYLSSSSSALSGGSWTSTMPQWASGKYVWTRTATSKTNASGTSSTTYSTAIYDQNLTTALSNANTAKTTVAGWCKNNNLTYIDGAKIYTGTIAADKIAVSDLYAFGATIGAFNIDQNSLYSGTKDTGTADSDVTLRGTGTFTREIGGTSRSRLKFAIGSKFGITRSGGAYMSEATITGGTINVVAQGSEASNAYLNVSYNNYYSWLGAQFLGFDYSSEHAWLSRQALLFHKNVVSTAQTGTIVQVTSEGMACYYQTNGSTALHQAVISLNSGYSRLLIDKVVYNVSCDSSSDFRMKRGIEELDKQRSAQFIYAQIPCRFRYVQEPDGSLLHHGLVAQDVEKTITDMRWGVVGTADDDFKTLSYTEMIADLIATVQVQHEQIEALERRLSAIGY